MTNPRKRTNFQGLSLGFGAIVCALAGRAEVNEKPAGMTGVDPPPDARGGAPAGGHLNPVSDDNPVCSVCADPSSLLTSARPPAPSRRDRAPDDGGSMHAEGCG